MSIEPGDVVELPWMPQRRFTIVAVDGSEVWAKDEDGKNLTLAADSVEKVA